VKAWLGFSPVACQSSNAGSKYPILVKLSSPLRYPGGKASLTGFFRRVIGVNALEGCSYYEPYAGGSGAALGLLGEDMVSEVFINDADERIYAFWHSVLNDRNRFVDKIFSVPLTIEEWYRQRDICLRSRGQRRFDVGFAAFFMNRCNRSGVIAGAGPIGGFEQKGAWRLDVRFSRGPLAERVLSVANLRQRINVSCMDALEFLRKRLPKGRQRRRSLVYLDPPYVVKGQRLYLNSYAAKDHAALAKFMQRQKTLPWLMSYDDTDLIRTLYSRQSIARLPIRYSLQEKRAAEELLIYPTHLAVPKIEVAISGEVRHSI